MTRKETLRGAIAESRHQALKMLQDGNTAEAQVLATLSVSYATEFQATTIQEVFLNGIPEIGVTVR